VGGDFYDVIVTAEDRMVLLIGDVCGRGADAASITVLARAVLRTVARDGASPSRALQHLNDAMRTAGV
jgi:serine phosphatase RsbU (regulator of sigma subunit)